MWQYLTQSINFLWLKLKELFPPTQATTHNYLPKIDNANKQLVKSNIYDNGTNVGIGTTALTDKLHIQNSSVGTGDIFMRISKAYDSSAVNRKSGIILGTNAVNYGNSWKIVSESDSGYMDGANLFFQMECWGC